MYKYEVGQVVETLSNNHEGIMPFTKGIIVGLSGEGGHYKGRFYENKYLIQFGDEFIKMEETGLKLTEAKL